MKEKAVHIIPSLVCGKATKVAEKWPRVNGDK